MNMESLLYKIKNEFEKLSTVNKIIASYLIKKPEDVVWLTGKQFSEKLQISQSSITRFCQIFGYSGFSEMKISLSQEIVNYKEISFHSLDSEAFKNDIALSLLHQNTASLQETCSKISVKDIITAANFINLSNKILCAGIGASDLVAQDMMQKLLRIQKSVFFYHDNDLRKITLLQFSEKDLLFLVSYSGEKEEILELAEIAKKQNTKIIALTKIGDNSLSRIADVTLQVVAFENEYRTSAVSSRISHLYLVDVLFYTYGLFFQEKVFEKLKKTYDVINKN